MKKMLVLFTSLLILITVIPICVGFKGKTRKSNFDANTDAATKNEQKSTDYLTDIEYIVCDAMQYINSDDNKDTKLAVLSVCRNNYIYQKHISAEVTEQKITKYSDELYNELVSVLEEPEVSIKYNNTTVFIPLAKSSPGYTICDEKYPYILKVASPWDTFDKSYNNDENSYNCGISVSGIKYLTESGSSFIQALSWYLPDFEIKQN